MREILFRGKQIDNGEWIEGYFEKYNGCAYINLQTERLNSGGYPIREFVEVIPETVGQYTGLTDKNGKTFFEGDICKHRSNYSGEYIISVVTYTDGEFLAMVGNNSGFCLSDKLEVIGNIHDNPELLKGGRNELYVAFDLVGGEMMRNKPKFNMKKVVFAWDFSGWGKPFACVMYDVGKGNYIKLIETEIDFSLFRVDDIKNAFNNLLEKYPTKKSLLKYWKDNFSGFNGSYT